MKNIKKYYHSTYSILCPKSIFITSKLFTSNVVIHVGKMKSPAAVAVCNRCRTSFEAKVFILFSFLSVQVYIMSNVRIIHNNSCVIQINFTH